MSLRTYFSAFSIAILAALTPLAYAQPGIPTNVKATAQAGSAQVSFDKVLGAVSYNVYWSKTAHVTKQSALPESPIHSDGFNVHVGPLENGTPYFIAVTSIDSNHQESAFSNEVTVTPDASAAIPDASVATSNDQSTGQQPAAADPLPVQPTTNVGQSSDTNVQNPTMQFNLFTPTDYHAVGLTGSLPNGTLTFIPSDIEKLVTASCAGSKFDLKDSSTYVVINVIKLSGANNVQTVASNNWYLYSKLKGFNAGFLSGWKLTDFDGATRLYGAKNILLVSILEYDPGPQDVTNGPTVTYKLTIAKQQPTNVSDALQLLGLVLSKRTAQAVLEPDYRACSLVPIAYKTSTIKVDLSYTEPGNSSYTASQSFVNEAKERWDLSFALPIKKASALQYDSTANTVTASQINKSDLYAVIDWYPYPADLKNAKFNYIPGIFAGVAMNSQPLHSLIFGASIGTRFAQFYAGALLLKQQDLAGLATGDTASSAQLTSATSYVYKPQFSVGIKISVSAAASAIAGSK